MTLTTTIEFNGKTYPLVRRLSYKEGLQIEDHLAEFLDINERLKTGDQKQVEEIVSKLKTIKEPQRKLVMDVLTKSLGKTEDEILDMDYAEVFVLFSKVWEANSRVSDFLGKNLQ